jgi:hypothetical protein
LQKTANIENDQHSNWLGAKVSFLCAVSAWVSTAFSMKITYVMHMEVTVMIQAISMMICLVGGTALLGCRGELFPKLGELA